MKVRLEGVAGRMLLAWTLILGAAGGATGQEAADTCTLTVQVLSETGELLPSAHVVFVFLEEETGEEGEVVRAVTRDGATGVCLPRSGRYRVTARARGHEERTETVAVSGTRVLRLVLPLDPHVLPPIVARGWTAGRASAVRSIDRVDFERQTLAYATLAEWLSDVPGVSLRGRGGGGRQVLSVRGSRPEEVLVLLDGVPMNDPLTGAADLSGIPTATLQTATLVRGTASRSYGSGAGAATLLLTSREADGNSGIGGGMRLGSFGGFGLDVQADAEHAGARFAASVAVDQAENDYPYRNPYEGGETTRSRINADTRGTHAAISGSSGAFRGSLRFDGSENGLPGRVGTRLFDSARAEDRAWTGSLGVEHSGARAAASFASRRLSYRASAADDPSSQQIHEGRLSGEIALPGTPVNASVRMLAEEVSGDAFAGPRRRFSPGLALESALLSDSFRLEPGIAVDLSGGKLILSPEVSVAWLPSSASRLWGRLGQGFRAPTFGDLYFRSFYRLRANPALLPERVTLDAELGASGQISLGRFVGRGSVVGWRRNTTDPIVWIPSSAAVWSPRNLGNLEAGGLEIGVGLETRERAGWGLRAQVAGTVQRSRVGFGSNRNPLPYQPDVSGQLSLGLWKGSVGTGVSVRYTGPRTTNLSATRTLAGFWVTDLSAHYELDSGRFALGLFAKIENFWDREYELTELFPEPGRRFSLRIEARKVRS